MRYSGVLWRCENRANRSDDSRPRRRRASICAKNIATRAPRILQSPPELNSVFQAAKNKESVRRATCRGTALHADVLFISRAWGIVFAEVSVKVKLRRN